MGSLIFNGETVLYQLQTPKYYEPERFTMPYILLHGYTIPSSLILKHDPVHVDSKYSNQDKIHTKKMEFQITPGSEPAYTVTSKND